MKRLTYAGATALYITTSELTQDDLQTLLNPPNMATYIIVHTSAKGPMPYLFNTRYKQEYIDLDKVCEALKIPYDDTANEQLTLMALPSGVQVFNVPFLTF